MSWGSFGTVFEKISQQFQSRIERLRNEKDNLNNEKNKLLNKSKPISARDIARIINIDLRIAEIKGILENNAKD